MKFSSIPNISSKTMKIYFCNIMDIHEKIEQARVSAGLTQDEMADKLGIKRSTYQYWEKKTPAISKIKLIEKALGLAPGYFTDEKNGIDEKNGNRSIDAIIVYKEKYLSLLEEIAEERKQKAKSIEDRLIQMEEMLLNKTSPEPGGTRDGKTIEVNEDIISLLYKIEDDQKKILTNFHKVRAYLELTGQPQVDKQTLADAAKQVDKIREQYASGELGKRNKVLAPSTVKDGEKKK